MQINEIDVTPVEFTLVDDRLLIAQCGQEIIGKSLTKEIPERIEYVLEDLINVVDCVGPFKHVEPATVTITDDQGNQIKNYKFLCRRLDISLNLFNKGYWLEIKVANINQRRPLVFEMYRDRIIDPDEVFH